MHWLTWRFDALVGLVYCLLVVVVVYCWDLWLSQVVWVCGFYVFWDWSLVVWVSGCVVWWFLLIVRFDSVG